ncbi:MULTISPECIES: MerR family transcriptional regulator [Bacillus]|nr:MULTISPECIES: MerR family transcriptional regulator [Bacillus amyloliquefaciens group]MED3676725.1 MerR family transcriptional regulator [Bacillus velezensis]QOC80068.1 MerR family transcriptional regulator [Bacillus velezensis]QRV09879.1 MerR family transcriptional regulator [Bacillus velezensis]QYM57005.1 MerR family transcriptional regulator [Bacillus velezensis]WKD95002.1 MerR family transcriptional regulator [Bacillus velezensis]
MLNEYVNLDNDITIIFCEHKKSGEQKEIYIDTHDLPQVSSIEGRWSLSRDKRGFYFVTTFSNGKQLNLKRFILGLYEKTTNNTQQVTFISDNFLDYRRCNLFLANNSKELNTKETKIKLKKLAKKIPVIDKSGTPAPKNNSKIFFTTREISEKIGTDQWNIRKWAKVHNIVPKKNKAGQLLFTKEQFDLFAKLKNTSKRLNSQEQPDTKSHNKHNETYDIFHSITNKQVVAINQNTGMSDYTFKDINEFNLLRKIFKSIN